MPSIKANTVPITVKNPLTPHALGPVEVGGLRGRGQGAAGGAVKGTAAGRTGPPSTARES
jgi:hypothetical protein